MKCPKRSSKPNSRRGTPSPLPKPLMDKEEDRFGWLLPVLGSILCCLPSLDGDFVFDDHETILNNPIVQGKVPLYELLSRDYWGTPMWSPHSHKSYRPITTFTFWPRILNSNIVLKFVKPVDEVDEFRLNHSLHGDWTLEYHLINLLLHSLVTYQVWRLLTRIASNRFTSQAGSLLFAVHPVHTEAICNVTGRAELLMAFFFLLALDQQLADSLNFPKLCFFSILCLLSKEQGIMLPVLILLCDLHKTGLSTKTLKTLGLISVLVYSRLWMNGFTSPKFSSFDNSIAFIEDPLLKVLSILHIWSYNLYLMVIPISQCFDYSMGCIKPIENLKDPRNLISFAIITPILLVMHKLYQQNRRLTMLAIAIGLTSYFPSSHLLLKVGFTVAERVLYLPSLTICILGAMSLERLESRCRRNGLWLFVAILTAISWQRSFDWRNELSLYSSGLKVCPENAKIHYNLGKILNQQGNPLEALEEYEQALQLNPNYEQAMNNLANIYENQGRFGEAAKLLRKAIKIRPGFAVAWMNLGIVEMKLGEFQESLKAFNKSLKLRPNSADCHFNLGNLLLKMERHDQAVESWRRATRLDPAHVASWTNILIFLDERGRCEQAIDLGNQIQRLSHPAIHFQLGTCHGQLGNFRLSESHLLKAIRINPTNSLYHSNLGVLYERWNRLEDAKRAYRKALSLDETTTQVTENLKNLLKNKNHTG